MTTLSLPQTDGIIINTPRQRLSPDEAQRIASNPEHSVWVNASAGSGKTTVLTKRVTRLLLSGVAAHKILCLTFTRAAAAEMSLRVAQQLSLWATCDEATLDTQLYELENKAPTRAVRDKARRLFAEMLACPGGMRIRTIHAFCTEILGRFPVEAGVTPHVATIEPDEADALRQQEMNRLLGSEHHATLKQVLGFLLDELGEKNLETALSAMRKDARKVQYAIAKHGGMDRLSATLRHHLDIKPDDTEERILRDALSDVAVPVEDLRRVLPHILESSSSFSKRGEGLARWLSCDLEARCDAYDEYRRVFLTGENEPYSKFASKAVLDKHPDIQTIMQGEAVRLQRIDARLEALQIADITRELATLHSAIQDAYDAAKKARGVVDYDDLITHTLALLQREKIGGWVMFKLDGGIDHILVDEAQDTSQAQWDIVRLITEEFFTGAGKHGQTRTLFVVGDEKQSIYSFQNADPGAFDSMYVYFDRKLREVGQTLHAVDLNVSFRSAPAVLRMVDAVFEPPEVQKGVSRTPITHQAALPRAGEAAKMGRVECWPLQKIEKAEEDQPDLWAVATHNEDVEDAQAALAQQIAVKIKGWLDDSHTHEELGRHVRPDDIMILLRQRGSFADLMVRALKKHGVPVTGVDRMHLIKQLPVMDVLALVQFILLPEDDLTLACLLRSPLLGVSEDALMQLALPERQSLWQALQRVRDQPAWSAVYGYLSNWLSRGDYMKPLALLTEILNLPCPGSSISGRHALWQRLGVDALDPLDELLNAAQHYTRHDAPNLQGFVEWLTASDSEIKRELDQGGGQVRIMTVHAAKGLEAPIVFLPHTTGLPDTQRMPKLYWSDDDVPCYIPHKPIGGQPMLYWQGMFAKQMEEYRRLLYVALTRASHCAIVCGWENSKTKNNRDHWYALSQSALRHLSPDQTDETRPLFHTDGPTQHSLTKATTASSEAMALPTWARVPLPPETMPATLRPSEVPGEASASPDSAYARGRIIHRLLQYLPDLPTTARATAAAHYLAEARHNLSPAAQQEIATEILRLFDDPATAALFGTGSRAEVPVAGWIGDQPVSGQIDRLCVTNDAVLIIDYKTNRPPPATAAGVPHVYRAQMAAYASLMRQIYPGKPVRCFLLWTYTAQLMEIGCDPVDSAAIQ
ncbi:MAG: double-strand break repair helicase AddA [Alphaproteobacteria bacterium]|nr:double-strand break repair helicase AddA [Alphaproteobacteria bacterium]MBV8548732.1 double-strand break repair helicase AddA [Alphaproteobacteria bacterium]